MTEEKLRILFVSRWYPHKEDPMEGLFVQRHAQAVSNYANVSVLYAHPIINKKILSPRWEFSTFRDVDELRIYYSGLSRNFPGSQIIKASQYLFHLIAGYLWLQKRTKRFKLVHVNILTRTAIFASVLKNLTGLPYLITEHWSRYLPITNTYRGILRKIVTRYVVRRAGAITVVTENLKNAMQRHGLHHKRFYIIPNVVDTNIFTPTFLNHSSKKLLHVSCFEDKSKNISGLLRATQKLSHLRNDFELVLVGDGQDFQKIKEYSQNLHLEAYVTFTGLIEKEEKLAAFSTGQLRVLITKPKIGAFGLNWQHCNHMTFFPSHSFEQYYQGVRRCWRFGQKRPVKIDIVTSEGELGVMKNLQRKAAQADKMFTILVAEMQNELKIDRSTQYTKKTEVPTWLATDK